MDLIKNKANNVRRTRAAAGVSQTALAKLAGISRQHLMKIEAGESVPTVGVAGRIAHHLGVTIDQLWQIGVGV